jgi:hypothetical protein
MWVVTGEFNLTALNLNKCKQFLEGSTTHPMEGDFVKTQLLKFWLLWSDRGCYGDYADCWYPSNQQLVSGSTVEGPYWVGLKDREQCMGTFKIQIFPFCYPFLAVPFTAPPPNFISLSLSLSLSLMSGESGDRIVVGCDYWSAS